MTHFKFKINHEFQTSLTRSSVYLLYIPDKKLIADETIYDLCKYDLKVKRRDYKYIRKKSFLLLEI